MRQARKLERRLRRTGVGCIIQSASKWDEYIQMVTQACRQRPSALIVFGGDGSVRLAASRIIPAKGLLGIVPCGCFNNIYASLYGHTDIDRAMELIQPGRERRIDAGMANRNFFLGQLISGVVPALIERLEDKKLPRLSMTWSKLAAKAADDVEARSATIKVDAYTFKTQPLLLHVHLLPDLLTLRFAPPAQAGDGKLFLIYDRDGTRDMVAQYIRDLRKNRYYYLDGMQLIRGRRISIAPAAGRTWLIDGDPIRFTGEEITIEVLPQVLRVFSDAAPQS
jgi:diacylglycerol kinase family enzyme